MEGSGWQGNHKQGVMELSGYIGKKWSVRADQAYKKGLVNKSMMRRMVLKRNGIMIAPTFLKWLINEGYICHKEWHHTGRDYQVTYFYDLADVKKQLDELDLVQLKREYQKGVEDCYPPLPYE